MAMRDAEEANGQCPLFISEIEDNRRNNGDVSGGEVERIGV
jgi:hypothetical protein